MRHHAIHRDGTPHPRARRHVRPPWIALVVLALVAITPAWAQPGRSRLHATRYYLSLGTSLSVGLQPDADGEAQLTDEGYADQLHEQIRTRARKLRLVKLGCPTETSTTMVLGGGECRYHRGSQLDDAVAFLHAHRRFVALVTLDIGANDVEPCADGGTIDQACLLRGIAEVQAHLPVILQALRAAAGPDVPIVAMNYYNPFLAAWLAGPEGQALALASAGFQGYLNGVLGALYAAAGVPVADVAAAFHSTDVTTLVDVPGVGELPLNVATICQLTYMCIPPPRGPNIHPNAAGYQAIAEVFAATLPPGVP